MDTMTDPDSYANNNGLCGMQIQVPCQKAVSPETKPPEIERQQGDHWSSTQQSYSLVVPFLSRLFSSRHLEGLDLTANYIKGTPDLAFMENGSDWIGYPSGCSKHVTLSCMQSY
ncbi:conserved hypothetical protein [Ricinus communis]|uniref:Uncharacterized protein n=1 Tax=Ricinus communis TaxID=3988 RepID=B9SHG0_RICCO|nr:conserved hypothetical protein [Ricinus communis]